MELRFNTKRNNKHFKAVLEAFETHVNVLKKERYTKKI